MDEILSIGTEWSPVISAVATVVVAVFAILNWFLIRKINKHNDVIETAIIVASLVDGNRTEDNKEFFKKHYDEIRKVVEEKKR